ncbi:MAG: fatty acid desaturase [Pseudobdellovibrionaceae bacterium]
MTRDLYKKYREQLKFNYQPQVFWLHMTKDLALWSSVVFLMQQSWPWAWLAVFPIAALLFRNLVFMHEAVHGVAHGNKLINEFLGFVSGALCFLPYKLWRSIHIEHHYWAGNFRQDSALELVKRYPSHSALTKSIFEVMWKTRFPWMALFQYVVFWAHSTKRLLKSFEDGDFWLSYFTPLLFWGGVLWALNSQQLLVLGGGILVYSLFFDYINLAHHGGITFEEFYDKKPTWEQLEIARTGRYPKWIEDLVLNFNFHAEHHMFPDLPWNELPKAHNLLMNDGHNKHYAIVGPGWLRQQRKKSFAEFIRPDLYGEGPASSKKAA